jgi:two-component system, LytTR family, sensor kinase
MGNRERLKSTGNLKQPKKYNLSVGAIVSLFISMLASVPRLLKADDADLQTSVVNIGYGFFLAMCCWIFHHYLIYSRLPWKWMDSPWIKYTLSILIGVLFSIVYHDVVNRIVNTSPVLLENVAQERKMFTLVFRGTLISGFQFFVTYYLHLSAITQQSKIENEKLKKENLQARLESLKQQISPHFLFNTLNTLSALSKENKVKEYVAEISNVYRYLLQYKENDMVTVSEELMFIDSYLYILRERFEEGLDVTINIRDSIQATLLPPLALQTLVENAVKHNIVSISKPLHIRIYDTDQFIVVTNNLQSRQSLGYESSQSGLNNINQRYKLLVNKEIVIERTDFEFTIKLPLLS